MSSQLPPSPARTSPPPSSSSSPRRRSPPRRRLPRVERARRAEELAQEHDGVAHRADLRAVGVSRADVRSEVAAGRWLTQGRHTVVVGNVEPAGRALLWRSLWETGGGSALDGVSALVVSGLTGFDPAVVEVSIPKSTRGVRVDGVRRHQRRSMPPLRSTGIPRAEVPTAAVNGAAWAVSDRQALLVLCLVLQQRLTTPDRLLTAWRTRTTKVAPARRALLQVVMEDLCNGAQSLGELDFAGFCREHGLPEPSRQVVRMLPGGRVYLDVAWEDIGLVVEIDGAPPGARGCGWRLADAGGVPRARPTARSLPPRAASHPGGGVPGARSSARSATPWVEAVPPGQLPPSTGELVGCSQPWRARKTPGTRRVVHLPFIFRPPWVTLAVNRR